MFFLVGLCRQLFELVRGSPGGVSCQAPGNFQCPVSANSLTGAGFCHDDI